MKRILNYFGFLAMFIALLMTAAMGSTNASASVSGTPDYSYAFDVGPPSINVQLESVQPCEFQIMIDRGVAVPVIELTTESINYTLKCKTIGSSGSAITNRQPDNWFLRAREKI